MTEAAALEMLRATVTTTLTVATPVLVAAISVGVVMAFLQAITSLQDQTLSAVPKAFAVGGAVLVTAPFTLDVLVRFAEAAFRALEHMGP
jgi:flagellar biosynthesis protein FliQ